MRPGISPVPASTRSHKYPHAGAEHIGIQVKVHATIAQSRVCYANKPSKIYAREGDSGLKSTDVVTFVGILSSEP